MAANSRPAIKICGINTPAALDAAITARAEYAGLVFHTRSPRHVGLGDAAASAARAAGRIALVGLFVDADDAMIADAVAAARLDVLQLHGGETPARVAELAARHAIPVWKAIPVATAADVTTARAYAGAAARILFDARTPVGTLPGGMGLVFDWGLLAGWGHGGGIDWGLAGGLTPGNVADAIRRTGAPLVDVSSGVESAPGVKDVDKIAGFAYAARHP